MYATTSNCNRALDPIFNRNIQTKFWGLTCETGLKYKQLVKKKYCITQAVLDPDSHIADDNSDFVSVIVEHEQEEHMMAVLRHGDIYQVNLNMLFDRENVTFYLKGTGTVNLLGYEVIDIDNEASASFTQPGVSGIKKSPGKKSESFLDAENSKNSIRKGLKKGKSPKRVELDEDRASKDYINKLLQMELNNSSDEEDEDFSVGDEDSEDADSDDYDEEEVNDSEEEREIMELEMQNHALDSEDGEDAAPTASQKRKKSSHKEKAQKRKKMESSPKPASSRKSTVMEILEASSNESSDTASLPTKKKNKKKNKSLDSSIKMDKSQQTKSPVALSNFGGGVEIKDLKLGYGPIATKGALLHVFYVGRLANKLIFDSVLPGKRPFCFKLGANTVIKGWEVGLEGMRAGGKRKIKVQPSYGYGNKSVEGVPPNSTLYFVVDLQAVSK